MQHIKKEQERILLLLLKEKLARYLTKHYTITYLLYRKHFKGIRLINEILGHLIKHGNALPDLAKRYMNSTLFTPTT